MLQALPRLTPIALPAVLLPPLTSVDLPVHGGPMRSLFKRRRLRAAFLALLSICAGFLAGEAGIRAVGLDPPPRDGHLGAQVHRLATGPFASVLEIELVPSKRGLVAYPRDRGSPARTVEYRINSRGFREREFRAAEPRGKRRVLCLGDSFTFGTGIDVQDTWPRQLERVCAREGLDLQAINLGVYRYNALQQEALLRRTLEDDGIAASEVLWCFYINDASGHGFEGGDAYGASWEARWINRLGLTSGTWETGTETSSGMAWLMGVRRTSALVDYASYSLHELLQCRIKRRNYLNDWRRGESSLAKVERSLLGVRELCARHGLELTICVYPALLERFDDGHPYREAHGTLMELAASAGVPCLDLSNALVGQDPPALWAHTHDRHPNGICNSRIANYLQRQLPLGRAVKLRASPAVLAAEVNVGTVTAGTSNPDS